MQFLTIKQNIIILQKQIMKLKNQKTKKPILKGDNNPPKKHQKTDFKKEEMVISKEKNNNMKGKNPR